MNVIYPFNREILSGKNAVPVHYFPVVSVVWKKEINRLRLELDTGTI